MIEDTAELRLKQPHVVALESRSATGGEGLPLRQLFIAALRMGMGEAMTAFTVQINCGSGMQSIDTAYQYIREGHSDLILAGGTDALSWSPLLFRKGAVDWYAHLMGARNLWQRLTALAGAPNAVR